MSNLAVEAIKRGDYEEARRIAKVHKIILNLHEMLDIKENKGRHS